METRPLLLPIALSLALAGCGNKGPLVLPPPAEDEAMLMEADAVDDAGAVADPQPADTDLPALPPDEPPVEETPEPPPDDGDGNG